MSTSVRMSVYVSPLLTLLLLLGPVHNVPIGDDDMEYLTNRKEAREFDRDDVMVCHEKLKDRYVPVIAGDDPKLKCMVKCIVMNIEILGYESSSSSSYSSMGDDAAFVDDFLSVEMRNDEVYTDLIRHCNVTAMMLKDDCNMKLSRYNCYYYESPGLQRDVETLRLKKCDHGDAENEIFKIELKPKTKNTEMRCVTACDVASPILPNELIQSDAVDNLKYIKNSTLSRYIKMMDQCTGKGENFNLCNKIMFKCFYEAVDILFRR